MTSNPSHGTGEFVEVVTPSGIERAALSVALPIAVTPTSVRDIRIWAGDVTGQLRVGTAQVQTMWVGRIETATGVAVGGWPLAEPCCAGTPPPDTADVLGVDRDPQLWECEACGDVVEPTYWAAMPLGRTGGNSWALPDAAQFANEADTAVISALDYRTRTAVDAARLAACIARRQDPADAEVTVRVGDVARTELRPDLWQPAAIVSPRPDDDGRAVVEIGFFGAVVGEPDPHSRTYPVIWRVMDRFAMEPADLVRMLPDGRRLAARAAAGSLAPEGLADAWHGHCAAPASWLWAAEVLSSLAADSRRALEPAAAGRSAGVEL